MDVEGVRSFCDGYPRSTSKSFGPPSNVLVYYVGGKKFAYFKLSEPEMWRFSVRVTPERFLELTAVPGIKPARYMARFHWVTIVNVATVPDHYLKELITDSYVRALGPIPKSRRPSKARARLA